MSQIYSVGVLNLFLQGFFPNETNYQLFDSYKISEDKFNEFFNLLVNYIKKMPDTLEKKLMKIAEICLSNKSAKDFHLKN